MSHVPTVLKSYRSVFDKMLLVDDNAFLTRLTNVITFVRRVRNVICDERGLTTGGNVVRGNRTVMQMKYLRDHPDMSYGSNKQWNQLCE